MISKSQVQRILSTIVAKDEFVLELIDTVNAAIRTRNFSPVRECLDSWEAVGEVDSVPGLRERILATHREMGFGPEISGTTQVSPGLYQINTDFPRFKLPPK